MSGYAGVSVTNMSSAWSDGLLFCTLIHRYRPDILDYDSLDTEDWAGLVWPEPLETFLIVTIL